MAAREFLKQCTPQLGLIRHDKNPECPPYPRGGFLTGPISLESVIRYFEGLRRITAIFEPANPLVNGHNMNLLFESRNDVVVEVVGPGFDASDLQRGDLSPHESWTFDVSSTGLVQSGRQVYRTSVEAYQQSVKDRIKKIDHKIRNSPDSVIASQVCAELGVSPTTTEYLRRVGAPILRISKYASIEKYKIVCALEEIVESEVLTRFRRQTGAEYPLLVSASYVNHGAQLVFWDIVSPALKYEGSRPAKRLPISWEGD